MILPIVSTPSLRNSPRAYCLLSTCLRLQTPYSKAPIVKIPVPKMCGNPFSCKSHASVCRSSPSACRSSPSARRSNASAGYPLTPRFYWDCNNVKYPVLLAQTIKKIVFFLEKNSKEKKKHYLCKRNENSIRR